MIEVLGIAASCFLFYLAGRGLSDMLSSSHLRQEELDALVRAQEDKS